MISQGRRIAAIFAAAVLLGTVLGWVGISSCSGRSSPGAAATEDYREEDSRPEGVESAATDEPPSPPPAAPRETSFVGVVTDVFGAPVAGCKVTCEPRPAKIDLRAHARGGGRAARRTAADGSFTMQIPDEWRDVVVLLDHPDFPPVVAAEKRLDAASVRRRHDLGILQLASHPGILVRVRDDASGAAIVGAQVLVDPVLVDAAATFSARDARRARVATDDLGLATLRGMPDGAYRLRIDADGFAVRDFPIEQQRGATRARTIEARLQKGYVLRGRVVDSAGQPVADASVRVQPMPNGGDGMAAGPVHATTSRSGDFRATRLPAGDRHLVLVDSAEHGSVAVPAVTIPYTASRLLVQMPARHPLEGVIQRADPSAATAPRPASGALVSLRPESNPKAPPRVVVSSSPGGNFSFAAIPAGRYILDATSGGASAGSVRVVVPCEALRITLRAVRRVTGRVVDAEGHGLPGARIVPMTSPLAPADAASPPPEAVFGAIAGFELEATLDSGPGRRLARSGAAGHFELALPDRSANHGSGRRPTLWIAAPGRKPFQHRIEAEWAAIPTDKVHDLGDLVVPPDRLLRGVVRLPGGRRISGRTARLFVDTVNGPLEIDHSRIDHGGRVVFDPADHSGPFEIRVGSSSGAVPPAATRPTSDTTFELTLESR